MKFDLKKKLIKSDWLKQKYFSKDANINEELNNRDNFL